MAMDTSGALSQVEITVPSRTAACVVFPGPVRDTDKAIAMLGGTDAIAAASKMSCGTIKCTPRRSVRFRGVCDALRLGARRSCRRVGMLQDGMSHPLLSYPYDCSRVLLKVTRNEADGTQEYSVEAVAHITRSHEFRGLADFQVSLTGHAVETS